MGNRKNRKTKGNKTIKENQIVDIYEETQLEENLEDTQVPQGGLDDNENVEDDALNGEDELNEEDGEEQLKDTLEDEEQQQNVSGTDVSEGVNDTAVEPKPKRHQGPTKMNHIARDPKERQHVDFTDMGEPCGPGSVLLSSYLGPLVREHVPIIIENWKKVSEDIKTILMKSIQIRCLWRSSKSRVVTQVRGDKNLKDRLNMKPNNVNTTEWRKFVMEKTSNAFKVVSDSYKERRQKQIPHTCERKGMVRLREDLVESSSDPSQVTRLRVWVKSRTRKDGTPVNMNAAEKIRSIRDRM